MRKTQAEKGRKLVDAGFPEFHFFDYDISIIKNLNYYSIEYEYRKKRKWAMEYWKKQKKPVSGLGLVDDVKFSTVGALIHMMYHRGLPLIEEHKEYIERKYHELYALIPERTCDTIDDSGDTNDEP